MTTTIYVPQLIESAEQAAALPVGTVAFASGPARGACHTKRAQGDWSVVFDDWGLESDDMIGWTALVPIEAEEEFQLSFLGAEVGLPMDEPEVRKFATENAHKGAGAVARYVTPWTELPEEPAALADCGDQE